MKKYSTNNGREFSVDYASALPAGHGHKEIAVILVANTTGENISKEFKSVTNNMPDYDQATDLEGQEKYDAFFELIQYNILDRVDDWLEEELY